MKKGTKLYWPNGMLYMTKLEDDDFSWWGRGDGFEKYVRWTDKQMVEYYLFLGCTFIEEC